MFELETVLAFGVGAGLVALAPMVKRFGNPQLSDSMQHAGRSMAKGGIKLGVSVAGAAGAAARGVARGAAEAAESLGDLVAEARHEMQSGEDTTATPTQTAQASSTTTEVTVE
jgi:hypothetical protein